MRFAVSGSCAPRWSTTRGGRRWFDCESYAAGSRVGAPSSGAPRIADVGGSLGGSRSVNKGPLCSSRRRLIPPRPLLVVGTVYIAACHFSCEPRAKAKSSPLLFNRSGAASSAAHSSCITLQRRAARSNVHSLAAHLPAFGGLLSGCARPVSLVCVPISPADRSVISRLTHPQVVDMKENICARFYTVQHMHVTKLCVRSLEELHPSEPNHLLR